MASSKQKQAELDVTTGIGPSPQTIAKVSARSIVIVIVAILAAILALAGIILPNLPASKIPPANQQTP